MDLKERKPGRLREYAWPEKLLQELEARGGGMAYCGVPHQSDDELFVTEQRSLRKYSCRIWKRGKGTAKFMRQARRFIFAFYFICHTRIRLGLNEGAVLLSP